DPNAIAALQRAPAYLRETSLFPYTGSLALVTALQGQGGYEGVNAAYAKPPDSTEQVLHPGKYVIREAPIAGTLPPGLTPALGSGWKGAGQDMLGELVFRLWLSQNRVLPATGTEAAAGWGGDRLVLLRGPNGATTVGMATEWDMPSDAAEFK